MFPVCSGQYLLKVVQGGNSGEPAWSDESRFLLHHVDGRVCVRHLPGEHMAPGCTMGRRQASGGSVMLWAMFCWETLGPAIHVDVTLTRTTYLSIVADHESDGASPALHFYHFSLLPSVSFVVCGDLDLLCNVYSQCFSFSK